MSPTLRPLSGYEPASTKPRLTWADFPDPTELTERWTSLRPVSTPQVTPPETPDDSAFTLMLTKILEVLDGRRQIGQLQALLAGPVYEATLTRLRVTPPKGIRHQLQTLRTCRPGPDTVELCARIDTVQVGKEKRTRALVARVERHRGQWQCVFLRLL
ncbi:hypothetical protein JOF56_003266 [Kibdelosporangium banguiense]|uniref:3-hydroxyacyl-CoA dehydrogenase n=1 Tax=Kibdelosporangium banguiense TaxID=1365924 RepID=A0ABS4TEU6_9PSEU|nr:Rv3235 family protein [Kibdelosporangium banguiense]MBP2322881.1 hypothetical protein [Kibdelosporangium banguiense]